MASGARSVAAPRVVRASPEKQEGCRSMQGFVRNSDSGSALRALKKKKQLEVAFEK